MIVIVNFIPLIEIVDNFTEWCRPIVDGFCYLPTPIMFLGGKLMLPKFEDFEFSLGGGGGIDCVSSFKVSVEKK